MFSTFLRGKMGMKNLYVFGNEYLEYDKFAREIAKQIKNVNIINCRSPDELLEINDNEILILDVVKDIKKTIIINNISQIKTRKLMSLHDFDLGFFLSLMKELGINKKIKIIGIPENGDIKEIADGVKACI